MDTYKYMNSDKITFRHVRSKSFELMVKRVKWVENTLNEMMVNEITVTLYSEILSQKKTGMCTTMIIRKNNI